MKKLTILMVLLFSMININSVSAGGGYARTNALDGSTISYVYENSDSFSLKFEDGGVSFKSLKGEGGKWFGQFNYKAYEVSEDMFFLAWHEDKQGFSDYVTLLIDFNEKTLYGSVYFPNRKNKTMFHGARIFEIDR